MLRGTSPDVNVFEVPASAFTTGPTAGLAKFVEALFGVRWTTPIGLVLRLLGRDPLERKWEPNTATSAAGVCFLMS